MIACDCLKGYEARLDHYVHCAVAQEFTVPTDNTAARTLAELASFRDIDTALLCLSQLTTR